MGKQFIQKNNVIMDAAGKPPPQSIDIEEVVLGTMISNSHLISKFPYLKAEVFYKDAHVQIYKALTDLYKTGKHPDSIILCDYLKNLGHIDDVGGIIYIISLTAKAISFIDTYVKVLMDKYFYRELIRLSYNVQSQSYEALKDPVDIAEYIQKSLIDIMDFDGDVQNNFLRSLETTMYALKEASAGDNIRVIKSGFKMLDRAITFRSGYICIIAGCEGSGKTKFVISLARGMLENEKNLAIEWFSMEDDRRQIICSFLAMDVKKTTKELQSINYVMTEKDLKEIDEISERYKNFNIEFYDRIASINTIITRSKRFGDKYKGYKKVIIIDNLGLVDSDKTGIERDDYIAQKLKNIADTTNAFIIIVHHFTKEIAKKQNIDDGYRPRKEYLKGSTRILDFVQQALFVNLPRKYPDLLAQEKQQELDFIGKKDIPYSEANFDKYLWSINSQRCKETQNITDLRLETMIKMNSLINNNVKDANGKLLTFTDILQRYTEYSNYIDMKNKGRDNKYLTTKASIYIFIVKKMYNENYLSSIHSPRSMYLYGKNPNLRFHIDDLFIVETIKNRDDDNINDNTIFRYIVDLGYNTFKEIPNDGSFK